jgi:predicted N-acyltransferase
MPESNVVENKYSDFEDYLNTLSYKSRKNVRYETLRFENCFDVSTVNNASDAEIARWYKMYIDVKLKNLYINTFTLPFELFRNIINDKNWDVLKLVVKPEYRTNNDDGLASVIFSYKGKSVYSPILMGMNYNYLDNLNCYKQSLYRMIVRAKELGLDTVRLGFGATTEKRKFGSKGVSTYAYIQAKDNYNLHVIGNMSVNEPITN